MLYQLPEPAGGVWTERRPCAVKFWEFVRIELRLGRLLLLASLSPAKDGCNGFGRQSLVHGSLEFESVSDG